MRRPFELIGATDLPYSIRTVFIGIYALISGLVLYNIRNNVKPGSKERIAIATILTVCNFILPAFFHPDKEILSVAVGGLNFMWLSTFKIFGWATNRGPLSVSSLSCLQFIAVAFLPISPVSSLEDDKKMKQTKYGNARHGEVGQGVLSSAFDFAVKIVVLAFLLSVLPHPSLPQIAKEFLLAVGLYLFIAIMMNCMGILTVGLFNLKVAPHFDAPFISSSFTDFWSRRWNLNTGYTMRFMVYDPICEGRVVRKGPSHVPNQQSQPSPPQQPPSFLRRAMAVCLSFVVSGIMHEFFIIYLRNEISWYWLLFFSAQGPIVVGESLVRGTLKRQGFNREMAGAVLPSVLSVPFTLGAMLLLGHTLFFPYISRVGIVDNVTTTLARQLGVVP